MSSFSSSSQFPKKLRFQQWEVTIHDVPSQALTGLEQILGIVSYDSFAVVDVNLPMILLQKYEIIIQNLPDNIKDLFSGDNYNFSATEKQQLSFIIIQELYNQNFIQVNNIRRTDDVNDGNQTSITSDVTDNQENSSVSSVSSQQSSSASSQQSSSSASSSSELSDPLFRGYDMEPYVPEIIRDWSGPDYTENGNPDGQYVEMIEK